MWILLKNYRFDLKKYKSTHNDLRRLQLGNPYHEGVVKCLNEEGLPLYDFRNPPHMDEVPIELMWTKTLRIGLLISTTRGCILP